MMTHGTKKWSTLTAAVLLALGSFALPQKVWALPVGEATWNQIAKTGQKVNLDYTTTRETFGEDDDTIEIKYNQLTTNDGTVLATFEVGEVAKNNNGFVSGGMVYDYLTDAISTAYTGSDTISITDGKISVKNMAWNEDRGWLSIGTNSIGTGWEASGGKNSYVIGADNAIATSEYTSGGNNNYVVGSHNITGYGWGTSGGNDNYITGASNYVGYGYANNGGSNNYVMGASNYVGFGRQKNGGNNNYVIGASNRVGTGEWGSGGNYNYVIGTGNKIGTSERGSGGNNNYVFGANNEFEADKVFAFGSNITSVASNSVVLGDGSSSEVENTVSVGTTGSERKIVHVANGTANTDAATYGQIAKRSQTLNLDLTESREAYVEDEVGNRTSQGVGNNVILSNDGTVLATFTRMGKVAANDYGFVSGADLWKETRDGITSTNYISANNSTGANLNALAEAIGAKTFVTDLYTADDSVEAQMKKVGNKTIKSMSNAVSDDASKTQKITVTTYDDKTSTIEIAGAGKVAENDVRLVNGNTVYEAIKEAKTALTLSGSDSIAIADKTVKVKNMAQSTSDTEVTNGTTKAKGSNAIAFGVGAQADGKGSIAIGSMNYTDGDYTTTLGYWNGASADYSASIGYLNRASEEKTYAFGYDNAIFGEESAAVGVTNALYGVQSAAIGYNNLVGEVTSGIADDVRTVSGNRSYVVGADNKVLADDAFVFGSSVTTVAKNSVVLGKGSSSEAENTVSVGTTDSERRIVHVANGTANTDAATFGQLIKADSYSATSGGDATKAQTATLTSNDGKSTVSISIAGEGTIASGDQRLVNGDTVYQYVNKVQETISSQVSGNVEEIKEKMTTEAGTYLEANDKVGKNLKALDDAIGEVKLPEGQTEFNVIDESLKENGTLKTSVADNLMKLDEKIGSLDPSRDRDSKGRGNKYEAIDSENTISANLEALDEALAKATSATSADFSKINSKIRYENATADGDNAIALGEGSNASGKDSISMGTNAAASGESSLALGNGAKAEGANTISFGTSATTSKENALAFGNKASASADNTLAFGNGATASAENAMAFGNGASVSEGATGSVAIGSGSTASEANVVSFGSEGSERRLTNVAAGMNDTDAVNLGQMNSAIGENFNYLKSSLTRDINKVGAGSAALAALRPEGFDPDDKFSMAVGFGHYKNANAGAIGAFYKPNYDTTFSIGATLGDGESMMNMGVSFKLGSHGKRVPQTGAALSQEVASLRETNEALKKDNASQAKEIADLKADNERMKEQIAMILLKMELSDTVEKSMVK